jgi:hypothetical protein
MNQFHSPPQVTALYSYPRGSPKRDRWYKVTLAITHQ